VKGWWGTKDPLFGANWGSLANQAWTYLFGAHLAHSLEFSVALLCYILLYYDGTLLEEAKEWRWGWVGKIVLFNLACELILCNFWHYMTHASTEGSKSLRPHKFNPANPYEPNWGPVGMLSSTTGQLQREVFFTTLGWLQSAAWQCVLTHCWANNSLMYYTDFWAFPVYSILVLCGVSYWREVHFYLAHRGQHPWWDRQNGLLNGDVGAFLYRHVHSLHHKSYNPGPWSGLCMHPVEHLIYYTVATVPPLLMSVHPIHFLWCKFHADIAPIGGHDGHDDPAGNGDFHWLHHAKFECNYGVPWPYNFDALFGTWVDYKDYKETGELKASQKAVAMMHDADGEEGADTDKEAPLLGKSVEPDQTFTMEDVTRHKKKDDCWIVLYGKVLNVTDFLKSHPGGEKVILMMAGKDATDQFASIHQSSGGFSLVSKWAPNSIVGIATDAPSAGSAMKKTGSGQMAGTLINAAASALAVAGTMMFVLFSFHARVQP